MPDLRQPPDVQRDRCDCDVRIASRTAGCRPRVITVERRGK